MARRLLLVLGLVAIAVPAWAAEVVEVRVGRHPDFTRVVFELDRAAGYRIERSDPASENAELIVSLEAGSIPRRIQSSKSFIEQVVVEPSGSRSVARIRLAKSGLKLKEMILASPPRIVLDVISEEGSTPTASSSAAATTKSTAPTAANATSPSRPAPSAGAAPTALAANAAGAAKSTNGAATQAPSAAARVTEPTRPGTATSAQPAAGAIRAPAPAPRVLATTEEAGAGGERPAAAAAGDASETNLARNEAADASDEWNDGSVAGAGGAPDARAAEGSDADARDVVATPAQAEAAAAKDAARERPMMVATEEDDAGPGWMTWALAAAGVAAVGFGGLVVLRRRNAASLEDEADEAGGESPFADAEDEEDKAEEEDANPFAELAAAGSGFGADVGQETKRPLRTADQTVERHEKHEKKPSESLLFDDAEETKMEGMEVISRSQASELGGAIPMMDGGSEEVLQMFREMQRRVAALESRIDELVDARDRLERQVAAQTEELRVQRAAIARTQRAVRNLARNDEGGEDEPTEPALRDPS